MAFRDDLEASHARSEALERRVAELEAENRDLRGEPRRAGPAPEPTPKNPVVLPLFLLAVVLAAAAAGAVFVGQPIVAAIAGALALLLCLQTVLLRSVLHIAGPNTALVVSGRKHQGVDGAMRGYRVVVGGRAIAMPLIEVVERLDLQAHSVDVKVENAYTKGGEATSITAAVDVHVARSAPDIDQAIERFLGRPIAEVTRVAAETLEGHIRGVLATLTYAEITGDREKLADHLIAESHDDMCKLGLVVDTLVVREIEGSPRA